VDRPYHLGEPVTEALAPPDVRRVERAVRCFDATGRLQRWPGKRSDQIVALWVVWSQLPADTRFTEQEVNAMLGGWHDSADHALLRRELVDLGLLQRTQTGSVYRRADRQDIPPEAAAAIGRFA
jgi:hypothetical protein